MRIGGGGSTDINQLQSDAAQFRNRDFVVDNGQAFFGGTNLSGVAAEFSHIQIYNPAGSGVELLIDGAFTSINVTSTVYLRYFDTELTTVSGFWFNQKRDGSFGVAVLRRQTDAAILGSRIFQWRSLANTPYTLVFPSPVLLPAATGLIFATGGVNVTLDGDFYGREI